MQGYAVMLAFEFPSAAVKSGRCASLTAHMSCFLQDEAKYLVFDGDVDAVWVENMNSVMDDNKLLTLPNGERIRLQPHCRLLFEVQACTESPVA